MPTNGTISVLAPAADDARIPITLHTTKAAQPFLIYINIM
jgi:hypothetical protein